MKNKIINGGHDAELAVELVNDRLYAIQKFLQNVGLVHFDLHFENILTDGQCVYLSDFGLALSSQFDLTINEKEFLDRHKNYDTCCIALNLLHSIITSRYGKENWIKKLKMHLTDTRDSSSGYINAIILKYFRVAILMDNFLTALKKNDKTIRFPTEQLAAELAGVKCSASMQSQQGHD